LTTIRGRREPAILRPALRHPGGRNIEAFLPRTLTAPCLAALLLWGLAGVPASAEDPGPVPSVELDDLLRLPSGVVSPYEVDRRGGATREQWRSRLSDARDDVRAAKKALRASLDELDEMGGEQGNWKMAPPGLGQLQQKGPSGAASPDGNQSTAVPLNYGLANSIRAQKQEVQRAERALRDLEIEANLAGVPEDWRQ